MKREKQLSAGYREMAKDTENERKAAQRCEALIGDSCETAEKWFRKLDELNLEPFPPSHQSAAPKRDLFE